MADIANLVSPVSTGSTPEPEVETKGKPAGKNSSKDALEAAELELANLSILEKKASIEDLNERLDERRMRRQVVRSLAATNGQTLNAIARQEAQHQAHCNHRKGGSAPQDIMSGQGNSTWFALMKHKMLNGDVWVRCMRCGKTWKPPARIQFTDAKGVFNEAKYQVAWDEYKKALEMPTSNISSSSYLFSFSDGGEYFREVTASSTLR